ncbi:MAG: hypothetical protein JWR83_444 [Aeromicrobium sp.]|nr:hypothetical protein [Aeromicrobium sp.]
MLASSPPSRATILALGLSSLWLVSAQATTAWVTIHTISDKTSTSATATVKVFPKVTFTGNVKIISKRITIKRGSTTLKTKVTSANLLPSVAPYTVTTYATYKTYTVTNGVRHYSNTHTKSKTQTLIAYRPCGTETDLAKILIGDTPTTVTAKLHNPRHDTNPGALLDDPTIWTYPDCDSPAGVSSLQVQFVQDKVTSAAVVATK